MTEVQPDLDSTLRRRFATPAEEARVTRTAAALEANGITVRRAPDSAEAKRIVLGSSLLGRWCIRARRNRSTRRASPMRSRGPVEVT